eukprot:gene21740-24655_t
MAIPSSLSNFVLRKVKLALAANLGLKEVSETELEAAAHKLVDTLAILHPTDKKLFSETGSKLAKAVSAINLSVSSLSSIDGFVLSDWLHQYDQYLNNNHSIFECITTHHTNISNENWSNVVENSGALSEYSSAAASMGSKTWVVECNQWMETFAINYFRLGGVRKHHIKKQRSQFKGIERAKADIDAENAEFAKLPSDLLSTYGSKIRLLDVGSCYNPFKHSENASQLDVTALDLYPSDPSVYQCDFLGLQVGATDSAPIIVDASESTEQGHEPDFKRQRTASDVAHSKVSSHSSGGVSQCLKQLPAAAYDAIVMSLVLNYLPTSEQRLEMVRKARALLVSPRVASETHTGNDSWPPHRNGLLLIAEKQSIFKSPASNNNCKYVKNTKVRNNVDATAVSTEEGSGEGFGGIDLYSNWVNAICSCGFELVKYHFLHTSDGRKSHLFVFATVAMDSVAVETSLKLSIKQDFDK